MLGIKLGIELVIMFRIKLGNFLRLGIMLMLGNMQGNMHIYMLVGTMLDNMHV